MKLLIISLIVAWLLSKLIKWIVDIYKDKKICFHKLIIDGGMPSSHTATVVSLATAIFFETGLSYLFVICTVFALIVMNDAQSVRLITSYQSIIINKLIKGKNIKPVEERVGHTFIEVLAGAALGIIVPLLIYAVFS